MARLDEGSILVETRKLPGISLTDSVLISNRIEKVIAAFPEVTGSSPASAAPTSPPKPWASIRATSTFC